MLKPDFDPSGSSFSDCSRLSDSGRTSPASVGMVLMAWCSASIFSDGPVMREVPVSTMAWQLGLQRFSWSPTATLCVETWNQSLRLASKTNCEETGSVSMQTHPFIWICQKALCVTLT